MQYSDNFPWTRFEDDLFSANYRNLAISEGGTMAEIYSVADMERQYSERVYYARLNN